MARLKLEIWDSVVSDCESCLGLTSDNLKAHYYLSQAQLALKDYDSALTNAQKAHQLCVQTGDKSLAAITAQVLRAKKDRWDWMEKRRTREARHLENEVIELMEKEREQALTNAMDDGEKREIEAEWEQKIEILRSTFEKSRSAEEKRREVPEWAIDDISFGIMVDPVLVSWTTLPACLLHPNTLIDEDWKVVREGIHHGASPSSPERSPYARALTPIRVEA